MCSVEADLLEKLRLVEARQDADMARRVEAGDADPDRRGRQQAQPSVPQVAEVPVPEDRDDDEPAAKRVREDAASEAHGEMPLPAAGEEDDLEPDAKRGKFEAPAAQDLDPEEPIEGEAGMLATLEVEALPRIYRPGKFDVCECFSPPRVVKCAAENGLRAGWSIDILHEDGITGQRWDLARRDHQEKLFELVRRDKPHTISLCPPCTKFCALLRLCRKDVDRKEWLNAVRLVNVAVRIAEMQLAAGRHFIFEHPLTAASWRLPSLIRLRKAAGVCEATLHMCMYGLTSTDAAGIAPAKKPTRILTSSTAIRDQLLRKCDGQHRHVQLISTARVFLVVTRYTKTEPSHYFFRRIVAGRIRRTRNPLPRM